ncbi:MAG: DUF2909 domain-containing protein [Gammaproteobacteria bacterium]|nr:MAG: DUF2909 domain-containing protein [Gammaproteobacteria bacterium]
MWFKVLIIVNLLLIVASLFSGAVFMAQGREQSKKLLGALKIRVALSVLLVCLLMFGFYSGLLTPHGV